MYIQKSFLSHFFHTIEFGHVFPLQDPLHLPLHQEAHLLVHLDPAGTVGKDLEVSLLEDTYWRRCIAGWL